MQGNEISEDPNRLQSGGDPLSLFVLADSEDSNSGKYSHLTPQPAHITFSFPVQQDSNQSFLLGSFLFSPFMSTF